MLVSRKVGLSGLAGAMSSVLVWALSAYTPVEVTTEAATSLTALLMVIIGYVVKEAPEVVEARTVYVEPAVEVEPVVEETQAVPVVEQEMIEMAPDPYFEEFHDAAFSAHAAVGRF